MENEGWLEDYEAPLVDNGGDDVDVGNDGQDDETNAAAGENRDGLGAIDWGDMLRYRSVKEVANVLRSGRLMQLIRRLTEFSEMPLKNAITKDDPEYNFVSECSEMVLEIEVEKSKVFKFLRDHYALRFPELAMFVGDGVTYAKLVKLMQNSLDLENVVADMDELIPSQLIVVIVAAASTSAGRPLDDAELAAVLGATEEMAALELTKQTLLEYIQQRMPLICPNLCAFLGTGITSQLFAMTSSVTKLASMEIFEMVKLGSNRGASAGGVHVKTAGFLMNSDLVACHPPQLRHKALRLVAAAAVNLARIDDNRRASDNSAGLKQRQDVRRKMILWTDPVGIRGAGNNTYERRNRKRPRTDRVDEFRWGRQGQRPQEQTASSHN